MIRSQPIPLRCRDIVLAAAAGFVLGFAVLFFAILFPADVIFQAQLLVRGPVEGYPVGYSAVVNERFQAATIALMSFWFWTAVALTSVLLTWWLLRCFRS